MNRRTLQIKIAPLGIGTNEAVQISRFELVCLEREGFKVAHAEVAGPGVKKIGERKRRKSRIPTRAAATDREPPRIRVAAPRQISGRVDAIGHVDDTPASLEALAPNLR